MSFSLKYGGKGNLWIGQFSVFPEDLFIHGVSTRHGGFSKGDFDSLNLGMHVNDGVLEVWENRSDFCEALEVEPSDLVTCEQVHGDNVVKVTREDAGKGACNYETAIKETDALITNERNLPLMLFFADCTPIMIADPVKKVIGVAHGGWKGTVSYIAIKTVGAMIREYGCKPEDMVASVGPAIGPCCYEVGDEVAEQFRKSFPEMEKEILAPSPEHKGKFQLNLWRCNELQLQSVGLKKENIDSAEVCTACNNKQFFSYRADKGKTGRIGALLCLR